MSSPMMNRMLGLPLAGVRGLRLRDLDAAAGRDRRGGGQRGAGKQDVAAVECAVVFSVFGRSLLLVAGHLCPPLERVFFPCGVTPSLSGDFCLSARRAVSRGIVSTIGYCLLGDRPPSLRDFRFHSIEIEACAFCIGGNSIAVMASFSTCCWTNTKRQNSYLNQSKYCCAPYFGAAIGPAGALEWIEAQVDQVGHVRLGFFTQPSRQAGR